jgi:uncharacterized protein YkwD
MDECCDAEFGIEPGQTEGGSGVDEEPQADCIDDILNPAEKCDDAVGEPGDGQEPQQPPPTSEPLFIPAGDPRDCEKNEGYSWNELTNKCERDEDDLEPPDGPIGGDIDFNDEDKEDTPQDLDPDDLCPDGFFHDGVECQEIDCGDGYAWGEDGCELIPDELTPLPVNCADTGRRLNPYTLECECPDQMFFSEDSQMCEEYPEVGDPDGGGGVLIPVVDCEEGMHLDPSTDKCVCDDGLVWDFDAKKCSTQNLVDDDPPVNPFINPCPDGDGFFDQELQEWDCAVDREEEEFEWVPDNDESCPANMVKDPLTGVCECPVGMDWDFTTEKCVEPEPTLDCKPPLESVFDPVTGKFVCVDSSPPGCGDSEAFNYSASVTNVDNSLCTYKGCTDKDASNYSERANLDDGTCTYPPKAPDDPLPPRAPGTITVTDPVPGVGGYYTNEYDEEYSCAGECVENREAALAAFNRTNAYRTSGATSVYGTPLTTTALNWSEKLYKACLSHAIWCCQNSRLRHHVLDPVNPDKYKPLNTAQTRAQDAGYVSNEQVLPNGMYNFIAENLGGLLPGEAGEDMANRWINETPPGQTGHRQNIENPEYFDGAVAVVGCVGVQLLGSYYGEQVWNPLTQTLQPSKIPSPDP